MLRPHFAVVEAKRVGRRFGKRKADVKAAAELIDDNTVMSGTEIGRIAKIAADGAAAPRRPDKTLKSRPRAWRWPRRKGSVDASETATRAGPRLTGQQRSDAAVRPVLDGAAVAMTV